MAHDLNSVKHVNGRIMLEGREWDGIDRPSYIQIGSLNADQARSVAGELLAAADEADAYAERMRQGALADKRAKLARLESEIEDLERDIADA